MIECTAVCSIAYEAIYVVMIDFRLRATMEMLSAGGPGREELGRERRKEFDGREEEKRAI